MTASRTPHESIRIAVLGCGPWGMNHLRAWRELGCLAIACDPQPDRRAEVKRRFPTIKVVEDHREVLDDPTVDAVVVATPASTHVPLALEVLEAGKDVLVEKPMALCVADGARLVTAADERQRILMVGHVLEYHPAVVKLRELVARGVLGRVRYLYANRLNFGRIRTTENALWSFAPHDVAVMVRLLGMLPEEIACHGGAYLNGDVADVTMTHLLFPHGVRAHVHVSWLHPFKEHRLVVVGDRKMVVFDDTAPWPEKLSVFDYEVKWEEGCVPVASRADPRFVRVDEAEPLLRECEAFLEAIQTRRLPIADGRSGLATLRILEAAQHSLAHGGAPVRLDRPGGTYIHPTAVVDPGAVLGEGVRIWHYTHVMTGATIGSGSVLGQNVFVGRGVRIGAGVKIQNNVSVYEGVELEDRVFCGPSVVFTNVRNPRAEVERKNRFERTLVRIGATIGANATILCGVTIGKYAFVGAGALVTRDVPDQALVLGSPARVVGWVCRCGERLEKADDGLRCSGCGSSYQTL